MTTQSKSYKLAAVPNRGKYEELKEVVKAYQGYLLEDSLEAERQVKTTGRVERYRNFKGLKGTQVMRRNSWAQVRGEYKRWEARAVAKGRRIIASLELEDEELRRDLFTLNKYAAWLQPSILKVTPSQEAQELALLLFQELLATLPLPLVGVKPTLQLSNGIRFERAKNSREFAYWLQVPSRTRNRPLRIPLRANSYFEQAPGKTSGALTLKLLEDGGVVVYAVKEGEVVPHEVKRPGEVLGIDWGFRNLFTTSDGRLLGQATHEKLLRWDAQLVALDVQLQRLGVSRKENKRFQRLQRRISGFVKNEVGRCLNQLEQEGWEVLAFEHLDFRGRGFSRRMNRLLTRAGRGAVNSKVARLQEAGQVVAVVNPAYTSQQCSSCDYTSRANRSGVRFSCGFCGRKLHADVNGARVVRERFLRDQAWLFMGREQVRRRIDGEFKARWGLPTVPPARLVGKRSHNGPPADGPKVSHPAQAQAAPGVRAQRYTTLV